MPSRIAGTRRWSAAAIERALAPQIKSTVKSPDTVADGNDVYLAWIAANG